jgi:hypothetical protein
MLYCLTSGNCHTLLNLEWHANLQGLTDNQLRTPRITEKLIRMDIYEATRKATSLAKSGDLDASIELLKSTIERMKTVGGYTNNGYTKIIPYFQKAGRYEDAIDYCLSHLIPAVKADCRITFRQKCEEIQEAFIELSKHQIYDKLRLNAKRESLVDDEQRFSGFANQHYSNYEKLLKLGSAKQKEIEYKEIERIFGENISCWPECFQIKHADQGKDSQ